MTKQGLHQRRRLAMRVRRGRVALVAACAVFAVFGLTAPAGANDGYRAVTGSGSTWSANMVEQWTADVKQFGISANFSATGSSTGRREFSAGTVDFAVSEIPYGLTDAQGGYDRPPERGFAYLPIVAGGTSFMYNLKVAGQRVTNLRLSGVNTARIFTGALKMWNDPAIAADNPGISLPARRIIPVVRSDGSGTTAQFTAWMAKEHPQVWGEFCQREGIRSNGGCSFTSNYPSVEGFVSQSGSLGVAGYVSSNTAEGAITYVEYSYALRAQFPVAKVLNSAGYHVEPTDQAVAVGLLAARINNDRADKDAYLTQDLSGVYRNADPRSYPLSSYSYMIIPTAEGGTFKADKGHALSDFLYYAVCEGQQAAGVLGYSPLPQNLVQAGLEQIKLIPGVQVERVSLAECNNPTFSRDGTNTLAQNAPQPPECDKAGAIQCGADGGTPQGGAAAAGAGGGEPVAGAAGGGDASAAPVDGSAGAASGGPAADSTAGGPGATAGGADGSVAGGAGTPGTVASANPTGAGTAFAGTPAVVGGVAVTVDAETGEVLGAVDPQTGELVAAFVDPETGEVVTATGGVGGGGGALGGQSLTGRVAGALGGGGSGGGGAGGGTTSISGVAVAAPGGSGPSLQTWFMVLAALSLLVATVGPPLLLQRFDRDRA